VSGRGPVGVVLASPKARRLAAENGVALARLQGLGSGPEGAVLAADVLRAAATGTANEAAPGDALSAGVASSVPITVEREVDAAELMAMLAWAHQRGSSEVTLGDLLARFAAAVWNRHPLAGSEPATALAYHRPLANGTDGAPLTALVPDAHQASLQTIAAARLDAGASDLQPTDPRVAGSEAPAALALVDLTDSRLDRSSGRASGALVTVVAGRLQQRVVAVEGSPAVRDTLPLTVAFDASRVGLGEAAAFADRLLALVEIPSDLLILY
jgi:pyruvate dehydrogenase E2 component (dihydrolipoamide acetyltransferase)